MAEIIVVDELEKADELRQRVSSTSKSSTLSRPNCWVHMRLQAPPGPQFLTPHLRQ